MKKSLLLMFLIPSISLGANVTEAQVDQAHEAFEQLIRTAQQGLIYTNFVKSQFRNGFTVQVPLSATTYPMPAAMQSEVVDLTKYNAIKASLVDSFGQLP